VTQLEAVARVTSEGVQLRPSDTEKQRKAEHENIRTRRNPTAGDQAIVPEFIRLPRVGTECPFTGLKRSKLNELILPNTQNAGHPKVKSFVLRRRGSKTGVRLVDYRSLADYIRAHPQEG